MPSHIHVLLGMWQDAVNANQAAFRADEIYVRRSGMLNVYTGYRLHNIHFVAYAAMFAGNAAALDRHAKLPMTSLILSLFSLSLPLCVRVCVSSGQFGPAMEAAEAAKRTMPEAVLSDAYLAQFFEAFYSIDLHVLIRFGKWDDILRRDIPSNKKVGMRSVFCVISPLLLILFPLCVHSSSYILTQYA
jgi:hypothetical protein